MKYYIAKIFMILAVGAFMFTACSDDDEDLSGNVKAVMLNKETLALSVGQSATLQATVVPEKAVNKSLLWTSDNNDVATVNENGEVTAVSAGEATITVTTAEGGFTAECLVTVTIQTEGILINKSETLIHVGDGETLTATVLPENASNQRVMWKSNNVGIATVDKDGTLLGISVGEVDIVAYTGDGKYSAVCHVTVDPAPIPVTGVEISKTEISVEITKSETIGATVLPGDASNKQVVWSSDNTDIATVDADGKITGVSVGTATITVTTEDGGFTASCKVTIVPAIVKATSIELDKTTLTMERGSESKLVATVKPDDTTDKKVIWTSSDNSVITVDENGKLTAVAAGKATITATANDGSGVKATCEVTVIVSITDITINPAKLSLELNKTYDLKTVITPADATEKALTWKSSNDAVASVDANGKVTAKALGTTTVTVTTTNGKSATCVVTVLKVGGGIDYGDYDKEDWE